jgi:Tol biopolymer transport system component
MRIQRFCKICARRAVACAVLAWTLAFGLLLAACGGPTPTPQIVVITATPTPAQAVLVVTATFTSGPPVQVVTATLPPTPEVAVPVPSSTSAATAGASLQPPSQPEATVTLAPRPIQPQDTALVQPTDTAAPPSPTATFTPEATSTSAAKPTAKAPSLQSYFVVYTAYKGPDLQDYSLWGMRGDGSGNEKILDLASEPGFSADSSKFTFYHWTDGLYTFDLAKETLFHVVHNGNASFPTWAPKGNRLAYFVADARPAIRIVNADGTGDFNLTPGMRPNWSLNGGFIAYDTCEENKCGIFRINPDGGNKRQLTSDGGGGAAASPNGKQIAYWSQEDGDFEIYVINADGSGRKQLTKNKGNDALPAWSPDGRYIYYLGDQNGKSWAVMVMDANGSNPRKIVGTNAGADPARGWQYQRITVTWNN